MHKPRSLAEIEHDAARTAVQDALVATNGELKTAASNLRVDVATIKRRLGKLDLWGWLAETFPHRRGQRIAVVDGQLQPHRKKKKSP